MKISKTNYIFFL